jgi:hypothetical protein
MEDEHHLDCDEQLRETVQLVVTVDNANLTPEDRRPLLETLELTRRPSIALVFPATRECLPQRRQAGGGVAQLAILMTAKPLRPPTRGRTPAATRCATAPTDVRLAAITRKCGKDLPALAGRR